jgi:hypothetical protein
MFSRAHWITAAVVTVIALGVYTLTLAPTVSLDMSAMLVTAAHHMGVGRCPGYPLWHLLGKAFTLVFSFVRFRGHPNPAWALNFMSAFFGALSCGLLSLLVCRAGTELLRRPPPTTAIRTEVKAAAAAFSAGLLFAFSPVMWSQAVVTETMTLAVFLALLFLLALTVWMIRNPPWAPYAAALLYGVGLAHSQLTVCLLPGYLFVIAYMDRAYLRDLALAVILFALTVTIGWNLPVYGFDAFLVHTTIGFIAVALLSLLLPRGKLAAGTLFLLACGLSLYVYLPLASDHNPPMNQGYARTWEGFVHVISRGQYEKIAPSDIFGYPFVFVGQVADYFRLLARQFTAPIAVIGIVPLIAVRRLQGPWRAWLILCLVAFAASSAALVWGCNPKGDIQDEFIQRFKFIPSFALWALLIGCGLTLILDWWDRISD